MSILMHEWLDMITLNKINELDELWGHQKGINM